MIQVYHICSSLRELTRIMARMMILERPSISIASIIQSGVAARREVCGSSLSWYESTFVLPYFVNGDYRGQILITLCNRSRSRYSYSVQMPRKIPGSTVSLSAEPRYTIDRR